MSILPTMKFIISLGMAGIILLTTNHLIKHYQHQAQQDVSSNLLTHALDVSGQIAQSLHKANNENVEDCSSKTLNTLREIRLQYRYVDDIGILKGQKIICTAVWGVLIDPQQLPKTVYITPNGYLLYNHENNNSYTKDGQGLTVMNNIVTVNSALSYIGYLSTIPKYRIELTTHNKKLVFFSASGPTRLSSDFLGDLFVVKTVKCSNLRDLCVFTYNNISGLRALSWPTLIIIVLSGLFFGYTSLSFIQNNLNARKSLESHLIRALNKSRLYMVYQPIVMASNMKIVSIESLVRWEDDHFGLVPPDFFVKLAEQLGLYRKLAEFVVNRTLHDLNLILSENPEIQLSINIGDGDIMDEHFLARLMSQCQVKNIRKEQIKLEITEKCVSAYENIASFCKNARGYGFHISLDDFGTGNANIAWLTELEFDEVKLDKALVNNITDHNKRRILICIVDGLRMTGKRVVFEGVETRGQMDFIRFMNPRFLVQGWYTGKPMSPEELTERIRQNF